MRPAASAVLKTVGRRCASTSGSTAPAVQKLSFDWSQFKNAAFSDDDAKHIQSAQEKYAALEARTQFNPESIPSIDFDHFRKSIQEPGVVDRSAAVFEGTNFGFKGQYDFDLWKPQALAKAEEQDPEFFEGRVSEIEHKKSNELEVARAVTMADIGQEMLNEHKKDLKQLEDQMDGLYMRTIQMELAEYPEWAEEWEEIAVLKTNCNGMHDDGVDPAEVEKQMDWDVVRKQAEAWSRFEEVEIQEKLAAIEAKYSS